jgi:hypothetical protein
MSVSATIQTYVEQPVIPFTTLETISLPVNGAAGTVPVSLGIGGTTQFQTLGAAELGVAVILAPDVLGRNTIQPTDDAVDGLVIKGHSNTATAKLLQVIGNGAVSSSLSVRPPGSGTGVSVFVSAADPADIGLLVEGALASSTQVATFINQDALGNEQSQLDIRAGDAALLWQEQTTDNPAAAANVALITPGFLSGLAASWKGRLSFACIDSASGLTGRTALILEADGAAPRVGFLGAPAVVQQTNGTAAQLAAITDANAKAFLTAISTGLVNLGLFAAPV